jgi:hypothetical protein
MSPSEKNIVLVLLIRNGDLEKLKGKRNIIAQIANKQ